MAPDSSNVAAQLLPGLSIPPLSEGYLCHIPIYPYYITDTPVDSHLKILPDSVDVI